MQLKGIDISGWQPDIKVGDTDADFVIVKATQGDNYINPEYHNQAKATLANGKLLGIYHFANGKPSAETEADFFIKAAQPYLGKAMLVLDWEADAIAKGPAYAKTFMDRVKAKTGVTCVIYMSKSTTRGYDWSSVAKTYPLWYAQYANYNIMGWTGNPWTDSNGLGAWKSALIFQYTSAGCISGYNANLDLNIFYGTREDWTALTKTNAITNSPSNNSSPSAATIDQMAQDVIAGKYGDGDTRKQALGSNYDAVQKRVNDILTGTATSTIKATTGQIQKMINAANAIADDNSHGYSQANRWGPDYDCSSLMYYAANKAGYSVPTSGTRYTGTMREHFTRAGFRAIPFRLVGLKGLVPGDILLNEVYHTEMYIGNGQFVGAHSNYDGRTGDSSGREISRVNAYTYSSGWDYVLRPPEEKTVPKEDVDLKAVTNTGGKVYRLVKSANHLLTLSTAERDAAKKAGWKEEGVCFEAPKGGVLPVYRLYNKANGDHLYTTSFKEASSVQKAGWAYEGVPFFGKESGSPVYRLYNKVHLFTTDKNEVAALKTKGWKDEGIGWYV